MASEISSAVSTTENETKSSQDQEQDKSGGFLPIALFLCCLGLLGLGAFVLLQKDESGPNGNNDESLDDHGYAKVGDSGSGGGASSGSGGGGGASSGNGNGVAGGDVELKMLCSEQDPDSRKCREYCKVQGACKCADKCTCLNASAPDCNVKSDVDTFKYHQDFIGSHQEYSSEQLCGSFFVSNRQMSQKLPGTIANITFSILNIKQYLFRVTMTAREYAPVGQIGKIIRSPYHMRIADWGERNVVFNYRNGTKWQNEFNVDKNYNFTEGVKYVIGLEFTEKYAITSFNNVEFTRFEHLSDIEKTDVLFVEARNNTYLHRVVLKWPDEIACLPE